MAKRYLKFYAFSAVVIFLCIFAFKLYVNSSGEFLSQYLEDENIENVVIQKFNILSNKATDEKTLSKEETESLSELLKEQEFKKIIKTTVPFKSKEGYNILGKNENGSVLLRIEFYGSEFFTGHMSFPQKEGKSFRCYMKDNNLVSCMESLLSK